MKTYQDFIQEAQKCWPGYKKKGTQKLFGKSYNRCVKEEGEIELEESSTGERSRGRATLGRGRGADMNNKERSVAAIAKKAGLRGTGKYSTKDLRTKDKKYRTDDDKSPYGDPGSTKQDTYIDTYSSPRKSALQTGIIAKKEYVPGQFKTKHVSSKDSVRKARDFRKALTRAGADKRGSVHSVTVMHRDLDIDKGDSKKRIERGKNFIQAIKDTPKHLEKAGAKKKEGIMGEPSAMFSGEKKDVGAKKRAKLYLKIFGKRTSKVSPKTGQMIGKVSESYELEESSTGERAPRGRATLGRGRGTDMNRYERTTAAIAKKAGLKGTGKFSTKDLRSKAKDYTTYDSEYTDEDYGSTEQDHFIHSYSSARKATKGETLVKKYKASGRTATGMTKLKIAPSSESVRRVKDLKKQMTKSGANKKGSVHTVDIMHRDSNVGKGDREQRMKRGRNFIQAVKDTPKHLKKAGAKKGDTVIGKPTAVMPGEDKKTGKAKRAKLYGKIFGRKSTKASHKTGLMTGKVD